MAAANPRTLVLGIDASQAGLCEAELRARKSRLGNALFAVAAAEALPCELDGRVDELTIQFPWGSLLRGLLLAEPAVMCSLARVLRPGAGVSALVSVVERDGLSDLPRLDESLRWSLAANYLEFGLRLAQWRRATADELAASHSSWAKRLTVGHQRPVWRATWQRVVT